MEANLITHTSTIKFVDQKNQEITDDIQLTDSKQKKVVAEKGVLKVTDVPGTSQVFKVTDENFEAKEITVSVTEEDKGERISLVRINVLTVKITDKETGKFDKSQLSRISLKEAPDKLVLKDEVNGIFVTENPIATDKTLTLQVVYKKVEKTQQVSSGKAVNEVIYEVRSPSLDKREILSWVALTYPAATVTTDIRVKKIKSVLLNDVKVTVDDTTNIGNAKVNYTGTLKLDPAFINAPEVNVGNFENIESVIVMASAELVANKTDILKTRSFLTFNKAFSNVELRKLMGRGNDNIIFSTIQKVSDLRKENFYYLIFTPEELNTLKKLFNV